MRLNNVQVKDKLPKDKEHASFSLTNFTPDMAALVQKLATLSAFGRGVLASISVMKERLESVGSRPECMTDTRLAPVRKHFASHFPMLLPEKDKNLETMSVKAHGVFSDLDEYVKVVADYVDYFNEVIAALQELSQSVPYLSLEANPEITAPVFDMLATLFRLPHHLATVSEVSVVVGLWAQASCVVNHTGSPDHSFTRMGESLLKLKAPTDTVQHVLEPFTGYIWAALANLQAWRLACERVIDSEIDNPFMLASRTRTTDARLSEPESTDVFDKLLLYHRVCDWSSVVPIACPWAVHEEDAWKLVQTWLVDGFLIPIFRDETLNIQKEWVEFVKRWKPADKGVKQALKAMKHKDRLKVLEFEGVASFPLRHKLRRLLLLQSCEHVHSLLNECPGLIGPKLPAVLALVACCIGELDVYFLHHKRSPRKAMKEYSEVGYNDESVLELVGAACAVIRAVRSHADVIKRYYTKYLHHAHAASLAVVVDHVKNGALLPPDSIDLLNAIVAQLDGDAASVDYDMLRGRSDSLIGTLFASTAASQLRPKVLAMESTAERQTFTVAVLETEVSDEALDECASVVVKVSLQSTSGTELASAHLATVEGTGVHHIKWQDNHRNSVCLGLDSLRMSTGGVHLVLEVLNATSRKLLCRCSTDVSSMAGNVVEGMLISSGLLDGSGSTCGSIHFTIASDIRTGALSASASSSGSSTTGRVTIVSSSGTGGRLSTPMTGVQASLGSVRSPNRAPLRALPTLVRRLRTICAHTEYVDKLDSLLDRFGRMKSLWWRRDDIEVMLNSIALQTSAGSLSRKFAPLTVLALADADSNCHPFTHSDEAAFGTAAVDVAQSWLSILTASVEEHVLAMVVALGKLDVLSGPGRGEPGTVTSAEQVVQQLTQRRIKLAGLVGGLSLLGKFVVYDCELDAPAFLRVKIADIVRSALREAGPATDITPLALPLQSHEVLRRTVDVCEWMGSHCFDVRHTVLEVLHSEVSRSYVVTGDALSATATPLTRSELLALPESVSRRLAVYFVRLVENDLNSSRPPIVYVPSRDGYQNCNHSAISQGGVNVVGTTLSPLDAGQLAMIARLVGPTGVRTIESALLGVVKHHVKAVKAAISKHVTVLESLEDDCTEADTLRGTIKECQSSLSHLFQTLMRIGDALVLRRLLLSASARVQQETAPVLPWVAGLAASTVQAIMQQLVPQCDGSSIAAFDFDALVPPPASIASNVVEALWDRLGSLSILIQQCNPHVLPTTPPSPFDTSDSLVAILAEECVTESDAKLWQCLPAACALVISNGVWDHALHVSEAGVFSNNAMVLPTAIHQLLCAAHKVSLRFLKPVSSRDIISLHCDVPRMPSYLHWLHMFVKIASTSCSLRTADCEAKRTSFFRERSTEYEAAGLLLEEFVRVSGLPAEVLDHWFPFSKIRSAVLYSEATKLRSLPKVRLIDTFSSRANGVTEPPTRAPGTAAHHVAAASEISVDALAAVEAPTHPPSQAGHREPEPSVAAEVVIGGDGRPSPAAPVSTNPFRPQSTSQPVRTSVSGVSSV